VFRLSKRWSCVLFGFLASGCRSFCSALFFAWFTVYTYRKVVLFILLLSENLLLYLPLSSIFSHLSSTSLHPPFLSHSNPFPQRTI
jgi:hypothetical protein